MTFRGALIPNKLSQDYISVWAPENSLYFQMCFKIVVAFFFFLVSEIYKINIRHCTFGKCIYYLLACGKSLLTDSINKTFKYNCAFFISVKSWMMLEGLGLFPYVPEMSPRFMWGQDTEVLLFFHCSSFRPICLSGWSCQDHDADWFLGISPLLIFLATLGFWQVCIFILQIQLTHFRCFEGKHL